MALDPRIVAIDAPGTACVWCGNDCVERAWSLHWQLSLWQPHCSPACLDAHSAYQLGKKLRVVRRDGHAKEELLRLLTLVVEQPAAQPLLRALLALLSCPDQAPGQNKPGVYRDEGVPSTESVLHG